MPLRKSLDIDLRPKEIQILRLFPSFYETLTSNDIEKALGISHSSVYEYFYGRPKYPGLIAKGLSQNVKGRNPALYGLTPKGVRVLRGLLRGGLECDSSDNVRTRKLRLRGHDIRLHAKINFAKVCDKHCSEVNLSRFQNVKDYQVGSWVKFEGRFEGDYFYLTSKSIVFQPVARYGEPFQVLLSIFEDARRLFALLEDDNPGLKIEEAYTFVPQMSFAFEGDEYARACKKLGEEFRNARFGIDLSKGVELEFWDAEKAADDAVKYKRHTERFVLGVVEDRIRVEDLERVREIDSRLSEMEGRAIPLLEKTIEYIEKFNAEFVRHDGVLSDIERTLSELKRFVYSEPRQGWGDLGVDWRQLNKRRAARGQGGNFR